MECGVFPVNGGPNHHTAQGIHVSHLALKAHSDEFGHSVVGQNSKSHLLGFPQ